MHILNQVEKAVLVLFHYYVYVCMSAYMHALEIRSIPRTGVTSSCELPGVGIKL